MRLNSHDVKSKVLYSLAKQFPTTDTTVCYEIYILRQILRRNYTENLRCVESILDFSTRSNFRL